MESLCVGKGLLAGAGNTTLIAVTVLMIIAAYLMGNISPSTLIAKAKGLDITKEGSGNAGTTNALRVLGKKAAVATLVIDILKGTIAVLLGRLVGGDPLAMVCVLAVFCGHVWPVFFRFKGGKGVATAFGALLGLNYILALICLAVVIVGVLISQRMSVGSVLGCIAFPFVALWLEPGFVLLGSVMAVLILIKHRGNIIRLFKGEEPKISFKK